MTKVFVITIKETGARYAYTSLVALFLSLPKEKLGVSKSTLDKFDFDRASYSNAKITVEKLNALSAVDARELNTIV